MALLPERNVHEGGQFQAGKFAGEFIQCVGGVRVVDVQSVLAEDCDLKGDVPLMRPRSSCRFIFLRKINPHILVGRELLESRVHDGAEMKAAELAGKRTQ